MSVIYREGRNRMMDDTRRKGGLINGVDAVRKWIDGRGYRIRNDFINRC